MFFCKKFAANILLFLAFLQKNAENDYFDQRLECAAPKSWLKYTMAVTSGNPGVMQTHLAISIFLIAFRKVLFCHLPFLTGFLSFWLLELGSYSSESDCLLLKWGACSRNLTYSATTASFSKPNCWPKIYIFPI